MKGFLDIDDVRSFVDEWNYKYPIDRWWRNKYNIPFGSPQHLSHPLLDMRIAFEDEHLHFRMDIESGKKENKNSVKYSPGRGDWLKKQPKFTKITAEAVDDAFNRLSSDLDNLSKNIAQKTGENGKQQIVI